MKFLFRCDGGNMPEYGTGHIVRDLILARLLKKAGHEVRFAFQKDDRGFRLLSEGGFPVTRLPESGELTALEKIVRSFRPDVFVMDHLDSDEKIMTALKKHKLILCTLDDQGKGASKADLVVNAMIHGPNTPYQGNEYVILPERAMKKKNVGRACKKIFISFGGFDFLKLTEKTLQGLQDFPGKTEIQVVGRSVENAGKVKSASGNTVTFLPRVDDFDGLLEQADMAFVSGGLTLFHALSAGVPSVVVNQYEHQCSTARRLEKSGAVVDMGMGSKVSPKQITTVARNLLRNFETRRKLSATSQTLIDRHGAERVADLLEVVRKLDWDTNFFKKNIARLFPVRLTPAILDYALAFSKKNRIDCLYYLADCHDSQSVVLAEKAGFHFVDIRLAFIHNLRQTGGKPAGKNPVRLRESKLSDIPVLRRIAAGSYAASRYFFDHHFPTEICARFYGDWIEKACRSPRTKVFVAEEKGKIAGYISCEMVNFAKGLIPLVGVADTHQGMGVGSLLVNKALDWFRKSGALQAEVVTQGRNYGAQRLYQRCGFVTQSTQLWYHKWFS